jgi:hypothetical protein
MTGGASFCELFKARLRSAGIELTQAGPSYVRPECLNIDLVMKWDDWIILLENKVAAASVTRNQLSIYYDVALRELQKGSFLSLDVSPQTRICVIYLTPTAGVGRVEFEPLKLINDRPDAKVHVYWGDVLADMELVFPGGVTDPIGRMIADGCSAIRRILKTRHTVKTVDTPERIALKALLQSIHNIVEQAMIDESTLKLTVWRDPRIEELYGNIGGRDANVYLTLYNVEAKIVDDRNLRIRASISFRVAGTAPTAKRDAFGNIPHDRWLGELGLPPGSLKMDHRQFLVYDIQREGAIDTIAQDLSSVFCRFLSVFRPFMSSDSTPST